VERPPLGPCCSGGCLHPTLCNPGLRVQTLVSFVNFKLYHELGLTYPPVLDARLEEAAAELYEIMRQLTGRRKSQGGGRGGVGAD